MEIRLFTLTGIVLLGDVLNAENGRINQNFMMKF
jgi:hypothetical protein